MEQVAALLQPKPETGHRLIDINEVKTKTGCRSDATVYGWIKTKAFPKPVISGNRFSRWSSVEVDAWILDRIRERDEKEAA